MRLNRVVEVFQERGVDGLLRQTSAKAQYWHRRMTFRPHLIQKTLGGQTFRVAINNLFAQGWIECRREWPELEWIKKNLLAEGDLVADCGANNGFTTIFFADAVGAAGHVVAFEPYPPNARDIRQNVALNKFENVQVEEKAVGDRNGEVAMLAEPNGVIGVNKNRTMANVPMVRLDDMFPHTSPNLIKIDVEGYELQTLRGATRIMESRPKLDIEVHPVYHEDRQGHCRAVFQMLANRHYDLFIQARVDGAIEPFIDGGDAVDELSSQDVFHVYARPRANQSTPAA